MKSKVLQSGTFDALTQELENKDIVCTCCGSKELSIVVIGRDGDSVFNCLSCDDPTFVTNSKIFDLSLKLLMLNNQIEELDLTINENKNFMRKKCLEIEHLLNNFPKEILEIIS